MLNFAKSQLFAPLTDFADNVIVDLLFFVPIHEPLPLFVSFAVKFSPLFPSLSSNNA